MTTNTTIRERGSSVGSWDRRRLLAVLAGVLAAVVLSVAGLVYAVVWALSDAGTATVTDGPAVGPVHVDGANPGQRRDAIASAPMYPVAASAATSGTPAAVPGPTITVPTATTVGPADVPTGFPRTPPGAVGQLAAIDTTVLSAMSIPHTRAVHESWALPGAPPMAAWVMTGNVQAFVAASGDPASGDPASGAVTVVTPTPVAGQVKGTDGPDWTLACVLLDVRATITASARIGYGHCERMQWNSSGQVGRWMIAPGAQPARAPSTWPGSAGRDAGWVGHLGRAGAAVIALPSASWSDYVNPFTYLAGAAGKVAGDAWTVVMLSFWSAGLWLLRFVLGLVDAFLTPDLREGGPGATVYRTTFWVAATLVLFMAMVQFGVAAFRRDGQSLARVAVGTAQFLMVWVVWLTYAVAVLAACGGLTRAVMRATMGVDAWSQWQPWAAFSTNDVTDAAVATVLGIMGLFLVLAAIGHLLVMLTRAGALLVLAATTPIAAAGLVSDAGRSWFWKSLRWFHAAAFTPVLMALVMGVGIQLTTGVVTSDGDSVAAAVGTAVPGVMLILIGCFAPLALFKMLAFVDPGTSSGAAMRSGLAAQGGLQGLLPGGSAPTSSATSGAASSTDGNGRSAGEDASADATTSRFASSAGALMGVLGPVGQAGSAGMGVAASLGSRAAAIGADLSNQMGVGHGNYVPDIPTNQRGSGNGQDPASRGELETPDTPEATDTPGGARSPSANSGAGSPSGAASSPSSTPMPPAGTGAGAGAGAGAGFGGGAAAAGAAAAVPIVPV